MFTPPTGVPCTPAKTGRAYPGVFQAWPGPRWCAAIRRALALWVVRGQKTRLHGRGRYGHDDVIVRLRMKAEDAAALLTYVRSNFGNSASLSTQRPSPGPWGISGACRPPHTSHAGALPRGRLPAVVSRLRSGWLVMGERQVFPGYCLLLRIRWLRI